MARSSPSGTGHCRFTACQAQQLNLNYGLTLDSDYVAGAGGRITILAGRLIVRSHLAVEAATAGG
jgi:hypothetical protein